MLLTPENPGCRMLNGEIFYFENPASAVYDIELVAKILGKKQRFNDHLDLNYSIAEHCYHASYLYCYNRKGALMHDAPEFIMGDLITPIKKLIKGYKEIEEAIDKDMSHRFEYELVGPAFKVVDTLLFQIEHSHLYSQPKVYDVPLEIKCWGPKKAARKFLERYYELSDNKTSPDVAVLNFRGPFGCIDSLEVPV